MLFVVYGVTFAWEHDEVPCDLDAEVRHGECYTIQIAGLSTCTVVFDCLRDARWMQRAPCM